MARALAPDPAVLVLDEPSASLDLMTRRLITEEIERQVRLRGITLVMVSHDLNMVARAVDKLLVLHEGSVVEEGDVTATLAQPLHPYTREHVAACDGTFPKVLKNGTGPKRKSLLLSAQGLVASYQRGRERSTVVDGLSLTLEAGECLALIGMSGAGKSTVVNCLLGLLEPDAGAVAVAGRAARAACAGPNRPAAPLNPVCTAGSAGFAQSAAPRRRHSPPCAAVHARNGSQRRRR